MVVTLVGIVTDVSPVPWKAESPIEVTLVGIVTDVSDEQYWKASKAIVAVLAAKVMTQGVVVHRLQQPVPSTLLHVTYNAH
jgi:hypothetical protein